MGGVCTGGTERNRVEIHHESRNSGSVSSKKLKSIKSFEEPKNEDSSSSSCPDHMDASHKTPPSLYDSGELCLSISREFKPSTPARTGAHKAPGSFLGKASSVGLEKAVEVLDTLGSSMANLNSGAFMTGTARGNKIFILAFEIANTITKGANLLQSLSEENVQYLKKEILPSKSVQQLVSTDMKELLNIAAADKREDFAFFSREVIRFGDMCKDPQWHNLGRYFSKLEMDIVTHEQLKAEAEMTVQELITQAQQTSELYHELHALDKFEQDYRRKLEEFKIYKLSPKVEGGLSMLQNELKHQRKTVESLKKKSLWSKSLEEVVEKLVDIVTFIHQEISDAFGYDGLTSFSKEPTRKPERLGEVGLALHYANLISQIDNIALRPTSIPENMRDTLYNGLPPTVKAALRSRFQAIANEELIVPQIKAEIGKTLQWLVPVATATTKAQQGFGWVGEWANTGHEFGKKTPANLNITRLQTLYHADRRKMDQLILELVAWLQRLISLKKDDGPKALPGRSPTCKGLVLHNEMRINDVRPPKVQLSQEDRDLLEEVMKREMLVPGISKSQELVMSEKRMKTVLARSRSTGSSPLTELKHSKANVLDVLDGLDSTC